MRDKGLVFAFVLFPLMLVGLVATLVATSSSTYHHQGVKFQVTSSGRVVLREKAAVPPAGSQAVAVADDLTFDFGVMDPLTSGTHKFMIRNDGTAPLKLAKGPTSCKCTLGTVANGYLEPGESTHVTLQWTTGRDKVYSHYATIRTNDPNKREIDLRVEGHVRVRLRAEPEAVLFGSVAPNHAGVAEFVLYSQLWDSFELVAGESTIDGVQWSASPLESEALVNMDARCGTRIRVVSPPDLQSGVLSGILRLTAKPSGENDNGENREIEIPIHGRIKNRISLYGAGIDSSGVVDMGHIRGGKGAKRRFLVRVHDRESELEVSNLQVEPEFVEVRLTAHESSSGKRNLYLKVEVPADAPQCLYLGEKLGKIQLQFDHPRIKELELDVKLAVLK